MGTMHRLKNKLRKNRDKRQTGAWALDEDSLRLNKQAHEDAARLERHTAMAGTVNEADDVEDMFYGRGQSHVERSASERSTASEPAVYRTTEQIHGSSTLEALQEDAVTRSAVSNASFASSSDAASYSTGPAAYHGFSSVLAHGSSNASGNGNGNGSRLGEAESLRAELQELKAEVQTVRREVMNELHVTRYDVMKELTLLKGSVAQLVAALQTPSGDTPQPSMSADERAALTRATPVATSQATRERIAASRSLVPTSTSGSAKSASARASVRLTQLAPVADSALSTPLRQQTIDELFPLLDFTSDLAAQAARLAPGTRVWALTRVEEWMDSRFNVGADTLLTVVGDGGSGKSTFCGAVAQQFRANLLAAHCCQFDRKSKSSPRNVLLSLVHQLVDNLPTFKNQLARLNLKYVLEETDPFLLAAKVLVDPLNAVDEPVHAAFILLDGLDQCAARGRNELQELLAQLLPQLPPWLGVLVASKPSKSLAKRLPVTSVLDFSAANAAFVKDVGSLVDDIARNFRDADAKEATRLLQSKSGGNFTYLEFTRQALSHPGMAGATDDADGGVPLDVLHDLPQSLYEIYAEIFEDKFGKGRARVWAKAQPLLALVVGATAGPYAPVTEAQAKEHLALSTDDLRMLRRSFVDLVAVRHGAYRLESSALCAWLSDPTRADEQFFVDVEDALQQLRKLRRSGSSSSLSSHSGSSSSGSAGQSRSTSPQTRTASRRTSSRQQSSHRSSQPQSTSQPQAQPQPQRQRSHRTERMPQGILKKHVPM